MDSIRAHPAIQKSEIFIWAIFLIGISILVLVFTPAKDMFLTQQQLLDKYAPLYPWLNRCDMECAGNVDAVYLDLQLHCNGLRALYGESQHSNLYDWRLAIDDRAASLNCAGFPKTLDTIALETRESKNNNYKQLMDSQREKVKKLEDYIAQEIPRFEQSLIAGDLTHLVSRFYQDIHDSDTMIITFTEEWFDLTSKMQNQISVVIWQKWAVLHSPLKFTKANISFIDINGDEIGGVKGGSVELKE